MEKLERIVDKIKESNPQAVILFGSAAKGEIQEDSDFDLLVIQETEQTFSDRIREMRMRIRTNTPLDIIVLTPQEANNLRERSSFFAQIFNEGRLVYGRV